MLTTDSFFPVFVFPAIASLEELSIAECKMATDVGMLALTQKKGAQSLLGGGRVMEVSSRKPRSNTTHHQMC